MTNKSSVTAAPVGLRRALAERYGLDRIELHRTLEGGYANDIYLAETGGRPLVVRVQRSPPDLRGLAWEHRLVRVLAERLPEIPAALEDRDGATFFRHGDRVVSVLPFRDGVPALRSDPRHREAAAALLARFHRVAITASVGQRPCVTTLPRLRDELTSGRYFQAFGSRHHPLPAALEVRRGEIECAKEWALAFLEREAREGQPVEGPIHGDYFPGNVLFRGARPVALVDWEEAQIDWTAFDLANGVWEFCKGEAGVDFDTGAAAAFTAAYRAAGGVVPPDEDRLLVPLIRVRRILELLRASYFDRDVDWDYQARNLDAFRNLG